MRYPIYVNGEIALKDLQDALASMGYHMRFEAGHRLVIDPIPHSLRRESQNVVPLARKKR